MLTFFTFEKPHLIFAWKAQHKSEEYNARKMIVT